MGANDRSPSKIIIVMNLLNKPQKLSKIDFQKGIRYGKLGDRGLILKVIEPILNQIQ